MQEKKISLFESLLEKIKIMSFLFNVCTNLQPKPNFVALEEYEKNIKNWIMHPNSSVNELYLYFHVAFGK